MKKIFWVFMIAVFFLISACRKPGVSELTIPAGSQIAVELKDVRQLWNRLKTSQLYIEFVELQTYKKFSENPQVEEFLANLEKAEQEYGFKLNEETIMQLIGQQAKIAFLKEPSGILLVSEIADRENLVKMLQFIEEAVSKKERFSTEKNNYEDFDITVFRSKLNSKSDAGFGFALSESTLLVASNPALFNIQIDLLSGKDSNFLAEQQDYKTAKKQLGDYPVVVFARGSGISASLKKIMQTWHDIKTGIDADKQNIVDTSIVGLNYENGEISSVTHSFLKDSDKSTKRENIIASLLNDRKIEPESLELFAKDALLAAAGAINFEKLKVLLQDQNLLDPSARDGQGLGNLKQDFNLTQENLSQAEEILDVLQGQAAFAIEKIDFGGFIPIPRVLLTAKLKDQNRAQELLKRLFNEPVQNLVKDKGFEFIEEEYEGNIIHYIPLPFGNNLSPGWTIIDDILVMGTSYQALTSAVDRLFKDSDEKADYLLQNEFVKSSLESHEEAKNLIFYYNNVETVIQLKKILTTYRILIQKKVDVDMIGNILSGLDNFGAFSSVMTYDRNILTVSNRFKIN